MKTLLRIYIAFSRPDSYYPGFIIIRHSIKLNKMYCRSQIMFSVKRVMQLALDVIITK